MIAAPINTAFIATVKPATSGISSCAVESVLPDSIQVMFYLTQNGLGMNPYAVKVLDEAGNNIATGSVDFNNASDPMGILMCPRTTNPATGGYYDVTGGTYITPQVRRIGRPWFIGQPFLYYVPAAPEIVSVNAHTHRWAESQQGFDRHEAYISWTATNQGNLPATYTVGLENPDTGETYVETSNYTAGPNNNIPHWETDDFSASFAPLEQWLSNPSNATDVPQARPAVGFVTLNGGSRVYSFQGVAWALGA